MVFTGGQRVAGAREVSATVVGQPTTIMAVVATVAHIEHVSAIPATEVAQPVRTTPTQVGVETPVTDMPWLGVTVTP